MKITPVPANDLEKLKALNEYDLPDAMPETDFGDMARIASSICKTPVSLVNIADASGHWYKQGKEQGINEMPCYFDVNNMAKQLSGEVFIAPDISIDTRFSKYHIEGAKPVISFYAAIPLVTPEKYVLGALCIADHKPGNLDKDQIETLKSLARQIVSQLDLRRKMLLLNQKQEEIKRAYADLEKFSHIVSHDLKSPLNNIISLTHLLKDEYGTKLDEEGNEYISFLNVAAYQLSDLVSGILNYSKSSQLLVEEKDKVNVTSLIEEITGLLNLQPNTIITYPEDNPHIYTSRVALKQILMNLLHNAIKYNNKSQVMIEVSLREDKNAYIFGIKDNGPGIAKGDQEKIFELFERLHNKKDGESMGIGLSVVKRLVEKLGGVIKINSKVPDGATFIFTLAK